MRWKRVSTKMSPRWGFSVRLVTAFYEDVARWGCAWSWLKPKVLSVARNPTLKHGVNFKRENKWQRRSSEWRYEQPKAIAWKR
ncbi:MAG: hypothetical protein J0L94_15005 [Rhodothermia bacterium]|nr:hypothetical protein [Rhodothermia bacterium]